MDKDFLYPVTAAQSFDRVLLQKSNEESLDIVGEDCLVGESEFLM